MIAQKNNISQLFAMFPNKKKRNDNNSNEYNLIYGKRLPKSVKFFFLFFVVIVACFQKKWKEKKNTLFHTQQDSKVQKDHVASFKCMGKDA